MKKIEREKRRVCTGSVVSNKMAQTVVVRVDRKLRHPLYGKVITSSKKYYAHDENAASRNEGELVTISECRPLSKLKRWRVVG